MMKRLSTISWALDRAAAYVFLPLMTFFMLMEVIARYGFNSPIIWSDEAVSYLLIIVLLLGLPECTRQNGHVRMDILILRMPGWANRAVDVLYGAIGIVVFGLIAKKTSEDIGYLRSIPKTSEFLKLPIWIYYAGIAALSAIMVLMFAMRIVHSATSQERSACEE